jgi:hypothetical protein
MLRRVLLIFSLIAALVLLTGDLPNGPARAEPTCSTAL